MFYPNLINSYSNDILTDEKYKGKTFNYTFPNIDAEIDRLSNEEKNLKLEREKKKIIKPSEVIAGSVFDSALFNRKLDEINEINRKRRKIKDKIKLFKLKKRHVDYDDLTIRQFKNGIILDTYDMFSELFSMKSFSFKNINYIINKNYRKIILLVIIFSVIILSYIIIYVI